MPNIFLFQTESGSVYHVDVDRQQWSKGTGRVWNSYLEFRITREGRLLFFAQTERNGLYRTLTTSAQLMVNPAEGAEPFIRWAKAHSILTDQVLRGYVPLTSAVKDRWNLEGDADVGTMTLPTCAALTQDPFHAG